MTNTEQTLMNDDKVQREEQEYRQVICICGATLLIPTNTSCVRCPVCGDKSCM